MKQFIAGRNITQEVETCSFFLHKMNPHMHLCGNKNNVTKRCGYELGDWSTCPLSQK